MIFRNGLLVAALATLLISCSSNNGNVGKYKPEVNPKPRYFMTIEGRVDPSLIKHFHLNWFATYYTTNPKCKVTENALEGVVSVRQKTIATKISLDKNGRFVHRVALDRYLPGYCRWSLEGISYGFSYKEYKMPASANTAFNFINGKKSKVKFLHQHWRCGASKCVLGAGSEIVFPDNMSSKQSYLFFLKFLSGE